MSYQTGWTPSRWCYVYIGIGGFLFFSPLVGIIAALGAASGLVIYCLLVTFAAWLFHKERGRPFTASDWRLTFAGAAVVFAGAAIVALIRLGIAELIGLVR